MKQLKWVTNCFKPLVPEYRRELVGPLVEGDPKPSKTYTVEDLTAMHYVGLYREVEEPCSPPQN